MRVTAIRTRSIHPGDDLFAILDKYVKRLPERSVLAVTSKIVAICEGRTLPVGSVSKEALIRSESDFVLPAARNRNPTFCLTVKESSLIPMAGIDETNGEGSYVLWPKDPHKSADRIRAYLAKRFGHKLVGVIITDSTVRPMRFGTVGCCVSWSGFHATNNYIGGPDLFGRIMRSTTSSVAEGLAAATVLAMGEGAECTPLALVTGASLVSFTGRNPTRKERDAVMVRFDDMLYAPFLQNIEWEAGTPPPAKAPKVP